MAGPLRGRPSPFSRSRPPPRFWAVRRAGPGAVDGPVRCQGAGGRYWRPMDALTSDALAAARGDRGALERFVRASQADVWRLCAHLGGREVADDLTQETYTRVWKALPSFRGDAS